MDKKDVVDKLATLEARTGRSPSVAEVAELCGCSTATAWKYLNIAARDGDIVKVDGQFMTPGVARAYKKG